LTERLAAGYRWSNLVGFSRPLSKEPMMTRFNSLLALLACAAVAGAWDTPSAGRGSPRAAVAANQPPVARVNLTVLSAAYCQFGVCSYNYRYDAYESYDPDGTIVSYQWVENGSTVSGGATYNVYDALRAYEGCGGNEQGTLIVMDNQGATSSVCYGYTPR
jgi:hypothetical protein